MYAAVAMVEHHIATLAIVGSLVHYVSVNILTVNAFAVSQGKYILGNNRTVIYFHWLSERRDSKPYEALDGSWAIDTYIFGAAQGSPSVLC